MEYVEQLLLNKSNKLFITLLDLISFLEDLDKYEERYTSTYSHLFYLIEKKQIQNPKNKVSKKINELICYLVSEKNIDISQLTCLIIASNKNSKKCLRERAFKNEEYFFKFLISTLIIDYRWTSLYGGITGYRIIKKWFKWSSVETIKKYINENIDIEKLEGDNLNAIKLFLQAYKDGFDEKIYYDFYTQRDITAEFIR
ncbi:hypothetical protein [Bernardetia sp.]|uniref:hypothetical protein n=1 Tax=Bernardetia sp. TaxID=1937974 RepID=UPI0025BA9528|nr:hypothetical protein [Bernardetia sp.]